MDLADLLPNTGIYPQMSFHTAATPFAFTPLCSLRSLAWPNRKDPGGERRWRLKCGAEDGRRPIRIASKRNDIITEPTDPAEAFFL